MSNHSLEEEWLGRQVVCAAWCDLGPGGVDRRARTECTWVWHLKFWTLTTRTSSQWRGKVILSWKKYAVPEHEDVRRTFTSLRSLKRRHSFCMEDSALAVWVTPGNRRLKTLLVTVIFFFRSVWCSHIVLMSEPLLTNSISKSCFWYCAKVWRTFQRAQRNRLVEMINARTWSSAWPRFGVQHWGLVTKWRQSGSAGHFCTPVHAGCMAGCVPLRKTYVSRGTFCSFCFRSISARNIVTWAFFFFERRFQPLSVGGFFSN